MVRFAAGEVVSVHIARGENVRFSRCVEVLLAVDRRPHGVERWNSTGGANYWIEQFDREAKCVAVDAH
jgi:hypothetical protein